MVDVDLQSAVLSRIATANGIERASMSLGDMGAVFHRSGDQLLCLCQLGSEYWNELEAEVIAERAIGRAARK